VLQHLLELSCFDGHFTVPYEQNTQQSLGLGRKTLLQFMHSYKN